MENEGEKALKKSAAHCLRQAALTVFVLLTATLALCALTMTARNEVTYNNGLMQTVTLVREPLLRSLLLSLAALAALLGVHGLLERLGGVRLGAGLCALWLAAAILWIWVIGMRQRADAQIVLADAYRFAHGNYDALGSDYLQSCTYQLGLCFPLHMLARLFSGATMEKLNVLAQCVNAALGVAGAGVLAALAQELLDRRAASATLLLYIASLPTLLFAQFVYNINLMILLGAGAMLCFARYARTGRVGFGLAYAALAGLATVAKPNAEIVLLALLICALLHGWANRDVKIVLFAALSFVIGEGLSKAIMWGYAIIGGISFRENVGMLTRLAMGMQESPVAAGWYNGYVEGFFSPDVSVQQEKAQALAAIGARLGWMRENPAAAMAFYREKLLTQWLDPAYDSLWMGELREKYGSYAELFDALFHSGSGTRTLMDGYMDAMQTAVYALSAVGGARLLKKKGDMAALALPVTILGGALYHLLFEAKAQYAYPYMVYMLPLAAAGLCALAEKLKKISG